MPGYLATPAANAASVSITPLSGLSAINVQSAISELLTKNNNVELKAVSVYADSSARTTAISSPTEGRLTYLVSTKMVEVFNGTQWVAVGQPDDSMLVIAQRMFTE